MARTVNTIGKEIAKGTITEKELRQQYAKLRSVATKRIQRIEKSDIPFIKGHAPFFMKTKDIVTLQALVRELADIERFLESPSSTRKGRVEQRRKTLDTLKKRGFDVEEKDYLRFINFMEWFKNSEYSAKYDSNADIVQDVFDSASPRAGAKAWKRLFEEFGE